MAQEGYDVLMDKIDSRYRLSMVVARRAGQLKQGVPSTLDGKPLVRADNAVTVAMKELETDSGVRWGDELPSAAEIGVQMQRDRRSAEETADSYRVVRAGPDDRDREIRGVAPFRYAAASRSP